MCPLSLLLCFGRIGLLLPVLTKLLLDGPGQPRVVKDQLRRNCVGVIVCQVGKHLRRSAANRGVLHSLINTHIKLSDGDVVVALYAGVELRIGLDHLRAFLAFDANHHRIIHILLDHREQHLGGVDPKFPEVIEQRVQYGDAGFLAHLHRHTRLARTRLNTK